MKGEYTDAMPPGRLNPPQVFDRLLTRIEKRIEALKGVKLAGYEVAIAELEQVYNLLLRARRYVEQGEGNYHGCYTPRCGGLIHGGSVLEGVIQRR